MSGAEGRNIRRGRFYFLHVIRKMMIDPQGQKRTGDNRAHRARSVGYVSKWNAKRINRLGNRMLISVYFAERSVAHAKFRQTHYIWAVIRRIAPVGRFRTLSTLLPPSLEDHATYITLREGKLGGGRRSWNGAYKTLL